jgi:hypothetical protein
MGNAAVHLFPVGLLPLLLSLYYHHGLREKADQPCCNVNKLVKRSGILVWRANAKKRYSDNGRTDDPGLHRHSNLVVCRSEKHLYHPDAHHHHMAWSIGFVDDYIKVFLKDKQGLPEI